MSNPPAELHEPVLRARAFRWAFVLGMLGVLCDVALLRASVPDLRDDIWEYAVSARHLLAGDGFRTSVVHPPLLELLRASDATVPILIHGPLMPLVMTPLVALFPEAAPERAWILAVLFVALTLVPLFRFVRRVADEPTATLAAAAYPWLPLTWQAINHDVVLTLGVLLVTLALDALWHTAPRPGRAGAWLGACYLARPDALLLLPVFASVAALGRTPRGPWRAASRLVLAFTALVLPWWVHNAIATGMPLFNLSGYLLVSYWPPYPNLSALLDPSLSPAAWRAQAPHLLAALPAKAWSFLPHALKVALLEPSAWAAPAFVLGLVMLGARRGRLAFATLGTIGVLTLLMAVTLYDPRYLALALPLVAAATATGWLTWARLAPSRARDAAPWALAALMILPALPRAAGDPGRARVEIARERQRLDAAFPGGEPMLLLSDVPDFAAWRLQWPVVWVDPAIAPGLVRPAWDASERWLGRQSHVAGMLAWLPRARGAPRQSWSLPAARVGAGGPGRPPTRSAAIR